jgi:beta-galactosidase
MTARKIGKNSSLYILDVVETRIYSGTLHFWRTPPKTWNDRIQDLKDAHCNTLDTYIAWNWHEPEEGKYDFHGKTDPRRDLEGFLAIALSNE